MLELILSNITILAGIALFSALVLYFAAKKFVVIEDTKIDDIAFDLSFYTKDIGRMFVYFVTSEYNRKKFSDFENFSRQFNP